MRIIYRAQTDTALLKERLRKLRIIDPTSEYAIKIVKGHGICIVKY